MQLLSTVVILVNKQLDAHFFMYVYFYSLHVSGSHVHIIRRIIVSMWHMADGHLHTVTSTKCHVTSGFWFWGCRTPRVRSQRANNYQGILRGGLAKFAWISSPKTTGKMAGWRLDPAARQCTRTHFTSCAAIFGQTRHRSVAAAAILTRSGTVWHIAIPKF